MPVCGRRQLWAQTYVLGSSPFVWVHRMEDLCQTLAVLQCCLSEGTELLQPTRGVGEGFACVGSFGLGPEESRVLRLQSDGSRKGLFRLPIAPSFVVQVSLLFI